MLKTKACTYEVLLRRTDFLGLPSSFILGFRNGDGALFSSLFFLLGLLFFLDFGVELMVMMSTASSDDQLNLSVSNEWNDIFLLPAPGLSGSFEVVWHSLWKPFMCVIAYLLIFQLHITMSWQCESQCCQSVSVGWNWQWNVIKDKMWSVSVENLTNNKNSTSID
jgi:hypothetical protein